MINPSPLTRIHRNTSTMAEICRLAAIILVPLAINPWGLNYELPKVTLLRGLILLTAAAHIVALAWATRRQPHLGTWLRRPLVRPILGVAGVTLLTSLTSISPLTSLLGSYYRQQGAYLALLLILWTLLLAEQLRSTETRRRLTGALIATGTLVALTPFVEALYWHKNPFAWRPGGTLGNPIFLGAYLIMVLPFTLAKVTNNRCRTFAKVTGWGVILVLQLLALLVTQSRGPWLGALTGAALFAALLLWPAHRKAVVVGLGIVTLLSSGLLAGLNFGLVPAEHISDLPYVNRIVKATDLSHGTTRVRVVLWQTAAQLVTRWPQVGLTSDPLHPLRPLLGYGPDTAAITYMALYPPELAHIEDPDAIWDRAHNATLDLLAMQGWLGLGAMALLGSAVTRRGWRLWRAAKNASERALIAAPLAALLAHLVEIQFAFSMTATTMMMWLCIAWLAAMPDAFTHGETTASVRPCARRWRVYAGIGAFLLVIIALRVEGGILWADTLAGRARRLDGAGQWEESVALYDRALHLIPWQPTYYEFRAETFFNLARALPNEETSLKEELFTAADRSLSRAQKLNPLELEYYANSGILHAAWSEISPSHSGETLAYYEQAFQLSPTRVTLRVDLGHILHDQKQYEAALAQYETALEIDPDYSPAHYGMGSAWQALGEIAKARIAFERALQINPNCAACESVLKALDK